MGRKRNGGRMQRGARRLQHDLLEQLGQVRSRNERIRRRLDEVRPLSYDGLTVERAIDLTCTDLELIGGCIETMHRLLVTVYEDLTTDEPDEDEGDSTLAERLETLEMQMAQLMHLVPVENGNGNGKPAKK